MFLIKLKNIFWIFFNYLLFKSKGVNFNTHSLKKIKGIPYIKNEGSITFGNINLNSSYTYNPIGGQTFSTFVTSKSGEIIIKNKAGISNSTLFSMSKITIEEYVLIGGDCKIYDTDFHSSIPEKRNLDVDIISKPVLIKKNAFIGGGSIILKGVTIGQNSIIGAGSVVSKDIPDNQIWAGNPAKLIRRLT